MRLSDPILGYFAASDGASGSREQLRDLVKATAERAPIGSKFAVDEWMPPAAP